MQAAGHGGEPVPTGAQPRDDGRERGDRLRTVAAAVVEHDDRAAVAVRHGGGHDARDPGPRPVPGVEVGQDHEVAVPAGLLGRPPVRRGQRVRLGGIRHPQQARADAGRAGQRVLGEGELEVLPPAGRGEVDMRVGVRADFVAVAQLLPHQPGVAGHVRAHHEECPWYPVMPQDRQNLRRPCRVRAVVEGQGHGPGRHRVAAGV